MDGCSPYTLLSTLYSLHPPHPRNVHISLLATAVVQEQHLPVGTGTGTTLSCGTVNISVTQCAARVTSVLRARDYRRRATGTCWTYIQRQEVTGLYK